MKFWSRNSALHHIVDCTYGRNRHITVIFNVARSLCEFNVCVSISIFSVCVIENRYTSNTAWILITRWIFNLSWFKKGKNDKKGKNVKIYFDIFAFFAFFDSRNQKANTNQKSFDSRVYATKSFDSRSEHKTGNFSIF